jgi:hypothetical protein
MEAEEQDIFDSFTARNVISELYIQSAPADEELYSSLNTP